MYSLPLSSIYLLFAIASHSPLFLDTVAKITNMRAPRLYFYPFYPFSWLSFHLYPVVVSTVASFIGETTAVLL
ncbi:hypothetical protein R3P38DRAFT_2892019 [Favolaschia claudopus]|uniref:Uncharacterized protein n=1 Tax=Favolaschia claudopus TaxID=2862362 RepID=A0AAW0CV83_9AGAR